jgi:hypothetical protein
LAVKLVAACANPETIRIAAMAQNRLSGETNMKALTFLKEMIEPGARHRMKQCPL